MSRYVQLAIDLDDPAARAALRVFADRIKYDSDRTHQWADIQRLLAVEGPVAAEDETLHLTGAARRRSVLAEARAHHVELEARRVRDNVVTADFWADRFAAAAEAAEAWPAAVPPTPQDETNLESPHQGEDQP